MKCHKVNGGLSKKVLQIAVEEGRKVADQQANAITARSYNEMLIAMHQSGISTKQIYDVQVCLKEAVLPKLEEIRQVDKKLADNTDQVYDADMWVDNYCKENGIISYDV